MTSSTDPAFWGLPGSAVRFTGGGFGPARLPHVDAAHRGTYELLLSAFKELKLSRDAAMEAFKKIDVNKDGLISPQELQVGLRSLGIEVGADNTLAVVALADKDENGRINYGEFLALVMPSKGLTSVFFDVRDARTGANDNVISSGHFSLSDIEFAPVKGEPAHLFCSNKT